MEILYTLGKEDAKEFGFTHLIANGWQGYYADKFNKKYNHNKQEYIAANLTDSQIDRIISNATNVKEV